MGKRKYADEDLRMAVSESRNMRQLLIRLGLAPLGGNYETVWRRIAALGLDGTHLRQHADYENGRRLLACSGLEIEKAVRGSRSYAQVLASLGLRPGGNQARLKRRIVDLGLDTSHFLGQSWSRGLHLPPRRRDLAEVLVVGRLVKTHELKRRLIQHGMKEHRCEICGLDSWNGSPIPLELDHVNGERDDNRLSNLRILCPNCHAQTPTYRGRNIGVVEPVS